MQQKQVPVCFSANPELDFQTFSRQFWIKQFSPFCAVLIAFERFVIVSKVRYSEFSNKRKNSKNEVSLLFSGIKMLELLIMLSRCGKFREKSKKHYHLKLSMSTLKAKGAKPSVVRLQRPTTQLNAFLLLHCLPSVWRSQPLFRFSPRVWWIKAFVIT